MKALDINDWHKKLIEIAKVFHEICVDNHISYYMLGGTMLGAIRHKGFIPWDDDMDFGVMQDDMPKLIEILKEQLPQKYVIRDENNVDYISGRLIKIEDTDTISHRDGGKEDKDQLGAFIDIFPLLRTNGRKDVFSRNGIASILLKLQYYKYGNYTNSSNRKKVISFIVKMFFFWIPRGFFSNIVKKYLEIGRGNYIVNFWGAWINKELVHKSIMGSPKLYSFEDVELYGVEKPDAYLSCLYGNYMIIPSLKERHLHVSNFYLKDK